MTTEALDFLERAVAREAAERGLGLACLFNFRAPWLYTHTVDDGEGNWVMVNLPAVRGETPYQAARWLLDDVVYKLTEPPRQPVRQQKVRQKAK